MFPQPVHPRNRDIHDVIGYVALGAVSLRIIWGFLGPQHSRFTDFVRGPKTIGTYLMKNLHGTAPRYIGHNPAAAIMMLLLMALVMSLGVTGYLMGTDRFWGEEWLEDLHDLLANALLVLSLVHAVAAIVESLRHRENLILSMVTGRKRP
jgi:cytochrome b